MKVARISEIPKESAGTTNFIGEASTQEVAPGSSDFAARVVNFGRGVRNHMHVHEGDQLLVVTAGRGQVVTEAGERIVVGPGDVVLAPAGEKHWHGALEDSEFSHITITPAGKGATWFPEEYGR